MSMSRAGKASRTTEEISLEFPADGSVTVIGYGGDGHSRLTATRVSSAVIFLRMSCNFKDVGVMTSGILGGGDLNVGTTFSELDASPTVMGYGGDGHSRLTATRVSSAVIFLRMSCNFKDVGVMTSGILGGGDLNVGTTFSELDASPTVMGYGGDGHSRLTATRVSSAVIFLRMSCSFNDVGVMTSGIVRGGDSNVSSPFSELDASPTVM